MKTNLIREHFSAHQRVVEASLEKLHEQAAAVAELFVETLRAGRKIIAFGNGGSATQASHLVGELLGRFARTRRPLAAIALASDAATMTCIANDFGYENLFARQIEALAQAGDAACGFTTSGRSENVARGLRAARERGAKTVALTGAAGLIGGDADYVLAVPSDATAHVQEMHLMLLHVWCVRIDEAFQ
jgi:D-sedoheptulose 7-phosphate isomerase